jgi:hypothetical protein
VLLADVEELLADMEERRENVDGLNDVGALRENAYSLNDVKVLRENTDNSDNGSDPEKAAETLKREIAALRKTVTNITDVVDYDRHAIKEYERAYREIEAMADGIQM